MAAYADDLTAVGSLNNLKHWQDALYKIDPKFGYYPPVSKSRLFARNTTVSRASTMFENTDIQITTCGQRQIGAVIGTQSYKHQYMGDKINARIDQVHVFSKITQ